MKGKGCLMMSDRNCCGGRPHLFLAGGLLTVALLTVVGCTLQAGTTAVPPNIPGNDGGAGAPVPTGPFTVFLSTNRSALVRGDRTAGSATATVTTTAPAIFRWSVDDRSAPILSIEVTSEDPTQSTAELAITADPGLRNPDLGGTLATLTVIATEQIACDACLDDAGAPVTDANGDPVFCDDDGTVLQPLLDDNGDRVRDTAGAAVAPQVCDGEVVTRTATLVLRRPAAPVTVVLTPVEGSAVAPNGTLNLEATISGGTTFPGDNRQCPGGSSGLSPENNGQNYCVNWSVSGETALTRAGVLTVAELPEETDDNGQVVAKATYRAPVGAVGNVVFTVSARDAGGNQDTATVPVVVRSARPLAFAEAAAARSVIAPGETVQLTATGTGGEVPYAVTYELVGTGTLGTLSTTGCASRPASQACTTDFSAPTNGVGPVLVRVTLRDAVGATASTTIALTVASREALVLSATFNTPTLRLGAFDTLRATIQGGTPPYTVCFGVAGTAGGRVDGSSGGGCGPIDNLGNCTCTSGANLQTTVVERRYDAGNQNGADTVTVKVRDAVGGAATTAASIAVSDFGGGGGGGGGGGPGGVTLALAVDHAAVCAGSLTEEVLITATATGGTNNDFTFVAVAGLTQVSESASQLVLKYTAPATIGTQPITVTVTSGGGSSASQTVNIQSNDSTCADGNACTADTCEFGLCKNPVQAGLACGSPASGVCDDPDTCDANGVCQPNHKADGPNLLCGPGTACTVDVCQTGACQNVPRAVGTACGSSTDTECDKPDTCDGAGACRPNFALLNTLCGNPGTTDCTFPDTCDGAGTCQPNHLLDGTLCNTDGNDCTADQCAGGTCQHINVPANAPCGNPAATDCTAPDTCDAGGVCQPNHLLFDSVCTDDGNECTTDRCNGVGVCTHPPRPALTPCGDPTDTTCDRPDSCDATGVCQPRFASATTSCGDPTNTTCNPADKCDGAGACVTNLALDGTPCSDAQFCTVNDECTTGICSGSLRDCSASGDQCNAGVCNEVADACQPQPLLDGTACSDGAFCNGDDTCAGGTCSVHAGTPCPGPCRESDDQCVACLGAADCDDANVCTTDLCDAGGSCLHVNNSNTCNDGNACTTNDACAAGACVGGPAPNCNDGNVCTDDSCNPATGCVNANNAAGCDDALFCTVGDVCSGGACGGTPRDCTGLSDQCNVGVCNEGADACEPQALPDGTGCDDGLFCTVTDLCTGGACGGSARDCTAFADQCNNGVCNEVADACEPQALPDGTGCDDGLFCTGTDTCSAGTCSAHAGDPCLPLNAADANCAESCDEAADACTAPDLDGSPCDDGLFCTGVDLCSGGTCSFHVGDPCLPLNTTDANCTGSCDEAVDTCTAPDPDASACDDGAFCNGVDLCLAGACDFHAGDPCLPLNTADGDCAGSCDEGTDNCTAPDPDATGCDDGTACNVGESCQGGACAGGAPPVCVVPTPVCDPGIGCVECNVNADCIVPGLGTCTANVCVAP